MNDAERDAWLREALRHAPDSDAAPPSGVSETILLKARAAAHAATPAQRSAARTAPANPVAAVWAWLARPPVAAGFASVMAATLVGLMWWDRPMDEGLPRPPAIATDRVDAAPPPAPVVPEATAARPEAQMAAAAPTAPAADELAMAPAPREAAKPSSPATTATQGKSAPTAAAPDDEIRRRQPTAQEQVAMADAKLVAPAAPAKAKADSDLAKERGLPAERKNETATPFPSSEAPRGALAAPPSRDAAADGGAKKGGDGTRSRAADVTGRPAAQQAPLASGRLRADEGRAAAANSADADVAKRTDSSIAKSAAGGAPAPVIAAAPAPAPARESAAPVPFRSEPERARPDASMRASPLADVLAADPDRWSRQTASGDRYALEAGWRAWLGELDAAAAGHWRALGNVGPVATGAASAAATARSVLPLRLVDGGGVTTTVRIEGDTVHVETSRGGRLERWQATLDPATAERLRTGARRLPP